METGKTQLSQHKQSNLTKKEDQEWGVGTQNKGWPGPTSAWAGWLRPGGSEERTHASIQVLFPISL